jgi:hypothetical protein
MGRYVSCPALPLSATTGHKTGHTRDGPSTLPDERRRALKAWAAWPEGPAHSRKANRLARTRQLPEGVFDASPANAKTLAHLAPAIIRRVDTSASRQPPLHKRMLRFASCGH